MNKRTWWKSVATALAVGGVGVAFADSPKVEPAVWSRASVPVAAAKPAPPADVVPVVASIPAKPLPEQTPPPPLAKPNYPLPPKSSSDPVVLPQFRAAPQPAPVVPVTTLPQVTMPPVIAEKIPIAAQPPIPPAAVEDPKSLVQPIPKAAPSTLPPIPELAPPAQPAKSADSVKPLPPPQDFNLRPVPGRNSVKTSDAPAIPPVQVPPITSATRPKPVDGPMPPTEKYVFPIPETRPAAPVTIVKPVLPAIPATLPKPEMPEVPAVPPKPAPMIAVPELPSVPKILPGVPTALERPLPPKTELNTIPTPGVDPMTLKQMTMAAAIGSALALAPASPVLAADPVTKTTDEKLADAQKEIKRLAELLDGRREADGAPSQFDIGTVKEIKKLKDDVFSLRSRVLELETELDKLKKSTTSLKPVQPDPMANKGVVRIENEYAVEIAIVVNAMSYRVPANTKLDVTVPAGDFTYQLLNSGANLAPVKSPIKEKEIVRLRIK